MIKIDIRERDNLFVLKPETEISSDDIASITEKFNNYCNTHDRIPNLVLCASSVPRWSNFSALLAHLDFIKQRHRLIAKVAIVSDSNLISLMRPVVDHFTGAKVRRFPEKALDDALNWAQMDEDDSGSFLLIDGLPDDVVALDAKGLITASDYRDTLVPLIEEKLRKHDKLKLLLVAGTYFDGFSAGAMWDDARLGFHHYATFSKLALVTDVDWLRHATKLFGPLLPTEIMVFDADDLSSAQEWIRS